MRCPTVSLFLDSWDAVGAKQQVMDFDEVFTEIQQNVIDGHENQAVLIQSGALYEVQDYVNRTEHVYSWIYVLVGNDQFEALNDEQQEAVKEAALEAQDYGEDLFEDEIEEIEQALKDEGMEFVDVDQDSFREEMNSAIKESISEEQFELYEKILDVEKFYIKAQLNINTSAVPFVIRKEVNSMETFLKWVTGILGFLAIICFAGII